MDVLDSEIAASSFDTMSNINQKVQEPKAAFDYDYDLCEAIISLSEMDSESQNQQKAPSSVPTYVPAPIPSRTRVLPRRLQPQQAPMCSPVQLIEPEMFKPKAVEEYRKNSDCKKSKSKVAQYH